MFFYPNYPEEYRPLVHLQLHPSAASATKYFFVNNFTIIVGFAVTAAHAEHYRAQHCPAARPHVRRVETRQHRPRHQLLVAHPKSRHRHIDQDLYPRRFRDQFIGKEDELTEDEGGDAAEQGAGLDGEVEEGKEPRETRRAPSRSWEGGRDWVLGGLIRFTFCLGSRDTNKTTRPNS